MIKLLYKPTGNLFTIPDEEALRIKREDRGNDYVVVDAGLQQKENKTISEEETRQIEVSVTAQIEQNNKAAKEEEEKRQVKEEKEDKKKAKVVEYRNDDTEELKKMSKKELVALAEKLGIRDMQNCTMNEIIEYIKGDKKKVLVKPGSGRTRK